MRSHLTASFKSLFKKLPIHIKKHAVRNYKTWKITSSYPSLHYKKVKTKSNTWSIRIGIGYRALGVIKDDSIIWFWIGSHAEYDYLLNKL